MEQLYLFYHDDFVLGGNTVYLPKLLAGLPPAEYMLIHSGSTSVKQYIRNSGIPEFHYSLNFRRKLTESLEEYLYFFAINYKNELFF